MVVARLPEHVIESTSEGAVLTLRVVPRASRPSITLDAGTLKLRVAAPPVGGAANVEIVRFLAKVFEVAKSDIAIISGWKSRTKRVLVRGRSSERACELLEAFI